MDTERNPIVARPGRIKNPDFTVVWTSTFLGIYIHTYIQVLVNAPQPSFLHGLFSYLYSSFIWIQEEPYCCPAQSDQKSGFYGGLNFDLFRYIYIHNIYIQDYKRKLEGLFLLYPPMVDTLPLRWLIRLREIFLKKKI